MFLSTKSISALEMDTVLILRLDFGKLKGMRRVWQM